MALQNVISDRSNTNNPLKMLVHLNFKHGILYFCILLGGIFVIKQRFPRCTFELASQVHLSGNAATKLSKDGAQYLKLLEMALTGSLYTDTNIDSETVEDNFRLDEMRVRGNGWPGAVGHTMVGHLRLQNIKETLLSVIENNVEGDFAEFGVWCGGSCIYAAGLLRVMGQTSRKVHVFDAFGVLDSSTGSYDGDNSYLAVNQTQVMYNFWKYDLLDHAHVFFHKGDFIQTAPEFKQKLNAGGSLAVLRIDGNFYDSYYSVLDSLYDHVSKKKP